jgi:fido (protein-threonine AMPylation protein)
MDKYGEMGDSIYCYPDSDILKNKLNIQDAKILQQAELELTEYASTRIEYAEPPYDLKYLQSIHFQLFSDLYAWAGELRQVDIAKGDTRFCTFSRIEIEANKLFKQLEQQHYFQGLAKPVLIQKSLIFIVLMSFTLSEKAMDALSVFSLSIYLPTAAMAYNGIKLTIKKFGFRPILMDSTAG